MATLKDVASLAGVSIAAVSLYINGKSQGRVSAETQHKIDQAIAETGYVPSSSKNTILQPEDRPLRTIAIFWSIDFKRNLLGAFIGGIQTAILDSGPNTDFDYIIRPYRSNELYMHKRLLCGRQYHGILIANASYTDMQYLQTITPQIPVVLINRVLPPYHCVYIDSTKVGEQAAELILEKGYSSICTVRSQSQYFAINSRFSEFIRFSREKGLLMPNEFQLVAEDSIEGGILAAGEYLSYANRPPVIFSSSDTQAVGILKGLKQGGVRVPEDCAVFSYGFERTELTEYSDPPLSVIDISTFRLANNGTRLMIDILNKGISVPQQLELPTSVVLRDSF